MTKYKFPPYQYGIPVYEIPGCTDDLMDVFGVSMTITPNADYGGTQAQAQTDQISTIAVWCQQLNFSACDVRRAGPWRDVDAALIEQLAVAVEALE